MLRHVQEAVRARGALAVDPKTSEGEAFAERILAWDEDATTLAIDAGAEIRGARVAVVGPGIDAETVRIALDLATVHSVSDPMAVAKAMAGPVLAIGCPPGTASAIAALVVDGEGADPKSPRDVGPAPRMVSAMRAMQEARRVAPEDTVPDAPMGAYVPQGTWSEDLPARLRLIAQRCAACGQVAYPPRGACAACRGARFEAVELPREAKVYAVTRIGRGGAPSEFALEQMQVGAYWVAVVDWPEQKVRVAARLSGYDEQGPRIGDAVRPVVRRLFTQEGRARYGVKFGAV